MTIDEMNERSMSSYILVNSNNNKQLKVELEADNGQVQLNKDGLHVGI